MMQLRRAGVQVLLIGVVLFAVIVAHELGHVVAARVLGDPEASFRLYYDDDFDGRCIGCTFFDVDAFSRNELLVVSAAGVVVTQALAVAAALGLRRVDGSGSMARQVLVTVIAVCLLDGLYQSIQGVTVSIPPRRFPTGVDAVDFAFLIDDRAGIAAGVVSWSLLGLSVVWIGVFVRVNWRALRPGQSIDQTLE